MCKRLKVRLRDVIEAVKRYFNLASIVIANDGEAVE
jgi:hypothetical protein